MMLLRLRRGAGEVDLGHCMNDSHFSSSSDSNATPSNVKTWTAAAFSTKILQRAQFALVFLFLIVLISVSLIFVGQATGVTENQKQKLRHQGDGVAPNANTTSPYAPNKDMILIEHVPTSESMCSHDANNDTINRVAQYCKTTTCMQHESNVDDELILASHINFNATDKKQCKMLWFAAVHESEDCSSYLTDYSVALESYFKNAHESLHPVLVLGRYATPYENSTKHKKMGKWAKAKGVKVIYSPRLSFQEDVNKGLPDLIEHKNYGHLQGPFLRLDIPTYVRRHNLFDLPNICKDHVLYTDADIIFANRISPHDLSILRRLTGSSIAMYGREFSKGEQILNTGLMVMNVEAMNVEFPKMLHQAKSGENFPRHDQELLNYYQEAYDPVKVKFRPLPMHYNWKVYWGLEPSSFSQVKIIHLHGPKMGKGLEEMATCNTTALENHRIKPYYNHFRQGVCCDKGRTAQWSVETIHNLEAPKDALCDVSV